jgi:hypothetical protein
MVTKNPPRSVPHLADGSTPRAAQVVTTPEGARGVILWTAPARGVDHPTTQADWRSLVRVATGPALSRQTSTLRPVTP